MNYNFTQDFFEKRIYFPLYKNIINKFNDSSFPSPNEGIENQQIAKVNLVEFIPSFIDCELNKDFAVKRLEYNYFKGFMCDLKNYETLQDYLREQLGKNDLKIVRRRLKRLESCFEIKHKVFRDDIDKETCSSLIDDLKYLIEKRFAQRGEKHSSLKNWEFYEKSTYKMLKDKKACLFVIYSGDKPIVISLDYLFDNIFESAISSYEIDYAKFGLGNTIILKKLEWCYANGFRVFNMRYGDYPYKRFWCNTIFDYRSQVIYSKNNPVAFFKALKIKLKNSFMYYLILNKKKFAFVKKLKSLLLGKKKSGSTRNNLKESYDYQEVELADKFDMNKFGLIDIQNRENEFLRPYVYNFQYLNSAKSNLIEVLKMNEGNDDIYAIKYEEKTSCFRLDPKSD